MAKEYYFCSLSKSEDNQFFTLNLPKAIYQQSSTKISIKLLDCIFDGRIDPPSEIGTVKIALFCNEIDSNLFVNLKEVQTGEFGALGIIEGDIYRRGRVKTGNYPLLSFSKCTFKSNPCVNKLTIKPMVLSEPYNLGNFNTVSKFVICFEIEQIDE